MSAAQLIRKAFSNYLTEEESKELLKKYDSNGDGVLSQQELTGLFLINQSKQAGAAAGSARPGFESSSETQPKYPLIQTQLPSNSHSQSQSQSHGNPKPKPGMIDHNPVPGAKTKTKTEEMKKKKKISIPSSQSPLNLNAKLSREQIKEIFREHDIDGDGFLNVSELTKAFSFLGSILPFYKAHYGLKYSDSDGDGLISETELDKLIDYAEKINIKK